MRALAGQRHDQFLHLQCFQFVVSQRVTGRRAERGVAGQGGAGQQALEAALACAAQAQFIQALLIERQCAPRAADLEAQVVFVAMLEPTAADRAPCAVGEAQH